MPGALSKRPLGAEKTELQPCTVKSWVRGTDETLTLTFTDGTSMVAEMLSLGFSVGTGPEGIQGEIIEVQSLDEVKSLGTDGVSGKIIFYNRAMDPTKTNTFSAYGGAVDQRVYGATIAAEFGALASIY